MKKETKINMHSDPCKSPVFVHQRIMQKTMETDQPNL